MLKINRRILSFLLSIIMVFGLINSIAYADDVDAEQENTNTETEIITENDPAIQESPEQPGKEDQEKDVSEPNDGQSDAPVCVPDGEDITVSEEADETAPVSGGRSLAEQLGEVTYYEKHTRKISELSQDAIASAALELYAKYKNEDSARTIKQKCNSFADFLYNCAAEVGIAMNGQFSSKNKTEDDLYEYMASDVTNEVVDFPSCSYSDVQIGDILFLRAKDKSDNPDGTADKKVFVNSGIITDVQKDYFMLMCVLHSGVLVCCKFYWDSLPDMFDGAELIHFSPMTYEDYAYELLTVEYGFNSAVACGIMANIIYESNFCVSVIGDSGCSYGICQWYSGRNISLCEYCKENNYELNNLRTQLSFMVYELRNRAYLDEYLCSLDDSARSAYLAAYRFCWDFEIPADTEEKAVQRGYFAKSLYSSIIPEEEPMEITLNIPIIQAAKIKDNYLKIEK